MFSKNLLVLGLVLFSCGFVLAEEGNDPKEQPLLRDEAGVNKLREEALAKLESPLEKMKIKASHISSFTKVLSNHLSLSSLSLSCAFSLSLSPLSLSLSLLLSLCLSLTLFF